MRIISDLHIHSRFSRACSKDLTIPNIAKACERKGIDFVGTGDALHPIWRKEIADSLVEREGAFYLADGSSKTAFCLTTEVSCIYKKGDKTRRLHHVIVFPDLQALEKVANKLTNDGYNLKSDGRPIMGLDSQKLLNILLEIDERILLIPAHAWTPWFAIFGSKSGFDSMEECFGEDSKYIHAIETGLSSDPPMNWRISALDRLFLVSNSDAHSYDNLGREANVFEMEKPSFAELRRILVEHDASKFIETLEFFPEEGKYHVDGHADCKFWCEPEKSRKLNNKCPNCGKPLTIGVLSRVQDLADRPVNPERPIKSAPFRSIIPLRELIADCLGVGKASKKVKEEYDRLILNAPEFSILLDLDEERLKLFARPDVVEGIMRMRNREVDIRPGYDGIFGEVRVRDVTKKPAQQNLL
ncbi:MAG: endonuclease Q family protein [Patescibacteria group bacterium]